MLNGQMEYLFYFFYLKISLVDGSGIIVGALVSGSSGLGSSAGRGHGVVFLGKTLISHSASPHPGV